MAKTIITITDPLATSMDNVVSGATKFQKLVNTSGEQVDWGDKKTKVALKASKLYDYILNFLKNLETFSKDIKTKAFTPKELEEFHVACANSGADDFVKQRELILDYLKEERILPFHYRKTRGKPRIIIT